jgi:hypothetical protein
VTFWELDRNESTFVVIRGHTPGSTTHYLVSASTATVTYDATAPLLDLSRLAGIRFQIPSTMEQSVAWGFCISNLCIE